MENSKQLACRFSEAFLNGKWIANTNYKEILASITWQEAAKKFNGLNTIAALTFHINYYVAGVLQALKIGKLSIHDKYSFDFQPIKSKKDWDNLQNDLSTNAEAFATLIEQMSTAQLEQIFIDEKYDTCRRNIEAMIEHAYYHLGQISLIKN